MTPEQLRESAKRIRLHNKGIADWWEAAEIIDAHAAALEEIERLKKEGYAAGFKAGREAGMREAAVLCQSHEPKDFTVAGIITRAKCADAILSAIGGDK